MYVAVENGLTGYGAGSNLHDTARRSQEHFQIARSIKPDVILLAHGAALSDPDAAQHMVDHTDCDGVQLGSAIERLAMEKPLEERAAAFKAIRFTKDRR